MDIQFQFKQLVKAIICSIPSIKEKITQILRNPIQFKIMKCTFSVGLIVFGVIFLFCYMLGVSRTQSFNIFHAFAFRYHIFYLIGLGITYLAYRASYYLFNDIADGDKLVPNGEKGSSEWMNQDIETFASYKFVIASKKNTDWDGEQSEDKMTEVIEKEKPLKYADSISINEDRIKRIQEKRDKRRIGGGLR